MITMPTWTLVLILTTLFAWTAACAYTALVLRKTMRMTEALIAENERLTLELQFYLD